jgi:hypothetical protein
MNSPTRLALWRSPGLTSRVIQFFKREQNRMPDAEFFGEAGPQRHSGILPKLPANWPILSDGRRLLGDKTDISLSVRVVRPLRGQSQRAQQSERIDLR